MMEHTKVAPSAPKLPLLEETDVLALWDFAPTASLVGRTAQLMALTPPGAPCSSFPHAQLGGRLARSLLISCATRRRWRILTWFGPRWRAPWGPSGGELHRHRVCLTDSITVHWTCATSQQAASPLRRDSRTSMPTVPLAEGDCQITAEVAHQLVPCIRALPLGSSLGLSRGFAHA